MKVGILGHFGRGVNLLNGQTVKTKNITDELQRQLGDDQVLEFDTHGGWKALVKAPFQAFSALKRAKNVIIFPAQNGLRIYVPMLSFFRRFFKKRKIHYVVIGGWLPAFIESKKRLSKQLKRFDAIYVETNTMKNALESQGFENVYVMPNCKKLNVLSENDLVYPSGTPYKLCTFSRVMKEKGIEDAINAVKAVNENCGKTVYTLDIYGQVDSSQTQWFDDLKREFPEYVRYMGCIDADKSVEVIKNYFALLFPTHYEGEGFAGTLIDAFSAGVPVIASDWKYNSEIVNENVGYIYPTGEQRVFVDIVEMIAMDPTVFLGKKSLCLKETDKYKIDKAIQVLIEQMGND